MGGRRVRRADLGLLQRAARAAAARAAPGPAPPRRPAAALPAFRARTVRQNLPGHRAGLRPAALAPGASPGRPPGRRRWPVTGGGLHDSDQHRARPGGPGKENEQGTIQPNLMASGTRRGFPAGAPPRAAPGACPRPGPGPRSCPPPAAVRVPGRRWRPAAADQAPPGAGAVPLVADPVQADGDVRQQDQVVVAQEDLDLGARRPARGRDGPAQHMRERVISDGTVSGPP